MKIVHSATLGHCGPLWALRGPSHENASGPDADTRPPTQRRTKTLIFLLRDIPGTSRSELDADCRRFVALYTRHTFAFATRGSGTPNDIGGMGGGVGAGGPSLFAETTTLPLPGGSVRGTRFPPTRKRPSPRAFRFLLPSPTRPRVPPSETVTRATDILTQASRIARQTIEVGLLPHFSLWIVRRLLPSSFILPNRNDSKVCTT